MEIPPYLKQHGVLMLVAAAWFLVTFWFKAETVDAGELEASQNVVLEAIKDMAAEFEQGRKWQKYNLEVDGLQDAIADLEQDMVELKIYIDNAPESVLTPGRRQLYQSKESQKRVLERELTQKMASPPSKD